MQTRIELAKALYKLRQYAELKQRQVAKGVHQSFVTRMESINGAFPNNESITSYVLIAIQPWDMFFHRRR